MPDKFDFDFVLNKNLNLKYFPVSQASVTFKVTGADDPLTLQRMRDAVSDEFKATQKKVNDFIQSRNAEISRLSFNQRRAKKDISLIDGGNETIQKFLSEFEAAADDALDDFLKKEKKKADKLDAAKKATSTSALKWVVSLSWSAYQGAKAVVDLYGASSPVEIFDSLKGFVEALTNVRNLVRKLHDQFIDEAAANTKVRAALKSLQSANSFTESDVKEVANLVSLYETKVLGLENEAKALSAKISAAVSEIPKDGITPEARKEAEKVLDGYLTGLETLSKTLDKVENQLQTFRLNLGAARQAAKEETQGWLAWLASGAYDFKDVAFALWEKDFEKLDELLTEKYVGELIEKYSDPENVVIAV